MKKLLATLFVCLCAFGAFHGNAQVAAIKTNLITDAAATINLGVEVGISPRWTFDINANYNNWMIKERQWKHWMAQPEFRYWFCQRFQGNFIAINALAGQYNFGNLQHLPNFFNNNFQMLKNNRVQGNAVGAGFAYGHTWILSKHINLEAEIGVGYIYTIYNVYDWKTGERTASKQDHHYVGPTKAAINLEYVF